MRIKNIHAFNTPPVNRFEVEDLSDLAVIAGPNGVGKSRLLNALINQFQNLNSTNIKFQIEATSEKELEQWGKTLINTENPEDIQLLKETLQKNQRRRNLKSTIFYYESNRTIQNVQSLQYQWDMPDPWEEAIDWKITLNGLANRFQDTLHAIFKKIQTQKTSIANQAISLREKGHDSMQLEFSDPLDPFRDAFYKLLGPKKLLRADVKRNTLIFEDKGEEHNINALSSGEREVLNITFDFLLRKPSDCIVFFDEPELHLHPELSAKLISTLKSAGENNQFILCSHSPDIISSSLDDTVVFLTPYDEEEKNQAVTLKQDDESIEILNKLGHSIGVVSLGRKIVLIEGSNSSLDKQTYTHILKNRFTDLVLLPSGGKDNLKAFSKVSDEILNKSIWGVDFFMLADHDSAIYFENDEHKNTSNFRQLERYHLENYFLDEEIISSIFNLMDPNDSWLRNANEINSMLNSIAKKHMPYAASLIISSEIRKSAGNLNIMPKGCHNKDLENLKNLIGNQVIKERERLINNLDNNNIDTIINDVYDKLEKSIEDNSDGWKKYIPGKPILSEFCNRAKIQEGRFKSLYIQEAEKHKNNPFSEIIEIFSQFSDN